MACRLTIYPRMLYTTVKNCGSEDVRGLRYIEEKENRIANMICESGAGFHILGYQVHVIVFSRVPMPSVLSYKLALARASSMLFDLANYTL